jgi:hypothetical protein
MMLRGFVQPGTPGASTRFLCLSGIKSLPFPPSPSAADLRRGI